MFVLNIGDRPLQLNDIEQCLSQKSQLVLTPQAITNIERCRRYLDQKLQQNPQTFYGINTGFGSLCNVKISQTDIEQLQNNLVLSHACGLGQPIPAKLSRLILLLKIQSLSLGYSGVSLALVQKLVDFYNHDILPVIYEQGSLGASGDLAPLAHLSLPLLNQGQIWHQDQITDMAKVAAQLNWPALKLQSKEGLALLNGTQFMSGLAAYCYLQAANLIAWANAIAALSLDAFAAKIEPFSPHIHQVRPHPGQQQTAQTILQHLSDSQLAHLPKAQVQDPYSFRCIPQVHGATLDALNYIRNVIETEINAVTDNPTIFVEQDSIMSGGNFHGQPLAIALDLLGIAAAELANISERRIFLLVSGQRGLPPFLSSHAGLNSGLMIAQYSAAAIVSQNKQLATPASVDSIVSSNGQEDHVSMGANAATKTLKIINNIQNVLGIELLCASQALFFRQGQTGSSLEKLLADFRQNIPFIDHDRLLHHDLIQASAYLNQKCPI